MLLGCDDVSLEQLSSTLKGSQAKQSQSSDTIIYDAYDVGTNDTADCFASKETAFSFKGLRVIRSYSIDAMGTQKNLKTNTVAKNTDFYEQLKDLPKNQLKLIYDQEGGLHPFYIVKIK